MIQVIDAGKGVDSGYLPNIFDRFSQEDSSSVKVHGGLGIGLAIVRNLVELQGGTIQAESGERDRGRLLLSYCLSKATVRYPIGPLFQI